MRCRLGEWARALKRDIHAIYLCAHDPRTPWYAKALAILVAGYALSPIDLIPDVIPVLGYLDDMIVVPLGILAVVRLIPPDVLAENRLLAQQAAPRPISRVGAATVILIWVVAVALTAWLGYGYLNSNRDGVGV